MKRKRKPSVECNPALSKITLHAVIVQRPFRTIIDRVGTKPDWTFGRNFWPAPATCRLPPAARLCFSAFNVCPQLSLAAGTST